MVLEYKPIDRPIVESFFDKYLYHSEDTCVEMRVFNSYPSSTRHICANPQGIPTTCGCWTRLSDRFSDQAARVRGRSTYATINPVSVATRPTRAEDCFKVLNAGEFAKDSDITVIKYVIIDIDPVTDGSRKCNSTNKELFECINVRDAIIKDLGLYGSSLAGISGNGSFVLLRLNNLENEAESLNAMFDLFKDLDTKYSNNLAKVDINTMNPSRLIAVPGTWKYRGAEETPERPYRKVEIQEFTNFTIEPFDIFGYIESNPAIIRHNKYKKKIFSKGEVQTSKNQNRNKDAFSLARKWMSKISPAIEGDEGSRHSFHVATSLVKGFDLNQYEALTIMKEWNVSCSPPWSDRELERMIERADTVAADHRPRGYMMPSGHKNFFDFNFKLVMDGMVPPQKKNVEKAKEVPHSWIPDDPASLAIRFVKDNTDESGICRYVWWNKSFYRWNGSFYDILGKKDEIMDSEIFQFIEKIFMEKYVADKANVPAGQEDTVKKKKVTSNLVENVKIGMVSLIAVSKSENDKDPFWLSPNEDGWNPDNIIQTSDGLLHLPSYINRAVSPFIPKTRKFFSTNSLDYTFNFGTYSGTYPRRRCGQHSLRACSLVIPSQSNLFRTGLVTL